MARYPGITLISRFRQIVGSWAEHGDLLSYPLSAAIAVWAYFTGGEEIPHVYALFVALGCFAFTLYILLALFRSAEDWGLKNKLAPTRIELWGEKRSDQWYVGCVVTVKNLYSEPLQLSDMGTMSSVEESRSPPNEKIHILPVIPAGVEARIWMPAVKLPANKERLTGELSLGLRYGPTESSDRYVMRSKHRFYFPADIVREVTGTEFSTENIRNDLIDLNYGAS